MVNFFSKSILKIGSLKDIALWIKIQVANWEKTTSKQISGKGLLLEYINGLQSSIMRQQPDLKIGKIF
jgi:hypothetical protein